MAEEGPYDVNGVLILGRHDTGYFVQFNGDEPSTVWNVFSTIATPDGRVMVDIGGTALGGYQTAKGLLLEAERDPTPEKAGVRIELQATWWETRLNARTGLFEATSRTFWHDRDGRGSAVYWAGEAVVVVANDSVFVDLYLENEAGGKTGSVFEGRLKSDGRFELRNESGSKRLKGQLSDGRFRAEWTDRREGGRYEGVLEARRE
jgi:hypothetical protein